MKKVLLSGFNTHEYKSLDFNYFIKISFSLVSKDGNG